MYVLITSSCDDDLIKNEQEHDEYLHLNNTKAVLI